MEEKAKSSVPTFDKEMTLGQIVDKIADAYFAAGADALTANVMALRDVYTGFVTFSEHAVELIPSIFRGADGQEVSK